MYNDVTVIYLCRDKEGHFTKNILRTENKKNNLNEIIITYHSPVQKNLWVDKWYSYKLYTTIYKQEILKYISLNGLPFLTHVHIGMKAGLMALWLKKKWAVPYVISEQWSGFLPEASEKFSHLPAFFKLAWKKVISNASGISVVSEYLKKNMAKQFKCPPIEVIPNVVNTDRFFINNQIKKNKLLFLHVSNLHPLKNADLIVKAFALVLEKNKGARLKLMGAKNFSVIKLIQSLQLTHQIEVVGEVPNIEIEKAMQEAGFFILFSAYENFGCVIIEANACGTPVIVSTYPTFYEIVTNNINGVFAELNNINDLANKMLDVLNSNYFNEETIATTTEKYSYPIIGKRFNDWYSKILTH